MPGKLRASHMKKTLRNVDRSNLSIEDKNFIRTIFKNCQELKSLLRKPHRLYASWVKKKESDDPVCSYCGSGQPKDDFGIRYCSQYCPDCGREMTPGFVLDPSSNIVCSKM